MGFVAQYGLFLAKALTLLISIVSVIVIIFVLNKSKDQHQHGLTVDCLNDKLDEMKHTLEKATLSKALFKTNQKVFKSEQKEQPYHTRQRLFVVRFVGDIKVSCIESLRREITAILSVVTQGDEVVVVLESPGGMVPHYGLAASQLQRIRDAGIPLTVCVDKIAASGGYLMACVANKILAAPFAYIGSIGVIAQIPNFHQLLKEHHIDFEQVTAGPYKRTLTLFGKNTEEGREKLQEDLEDIHFLFKQHITHFRPNVDIERVATGEHWLASRAIELNLVDALATSDDYLMQASKTKAIYQIKAHQKKTLFSKLTQSVSALLGTLNINSYY